MRRDRNWPYPRHPQGPNDPVHGRKPYFERHIYLFRDQLRYDISSIVGIVSQTRRTEDGKEDPSLKNAMDTYSGLIDRWIDKYVGLAKGRMSAYLLERFHTTTSDTIGNANEIDIELEVPEYWDDTVFEPLKQSVHDYVVNGTMYELFNLVLPPKENVVNQKRIDMEESYHDIKRYICSSKPGRVKKPLQPF